MDIILSNSSDKPIYEQIASQIRAHILAGTLVSGEKLPSIRALANGLGVSVITTKRAYSDLEEAGFIETVQGKGCFVAAGNILFYGKCHQKRGLKYRSDQLKIFIAGKGLNITSAQQNFSAAWLI